MKRLFLALALLAAPAWGAQQKPLILSAGQFRQIPAGDTLVLPAPTTAGASVNLPHGTAPTSPSNGDCWTTAVGLYCQISGATVGPYVMPTTTADTLVPSIATGYQDAGPTYPYQDFNVIRHAYGTTSTPIIPLVTGGGYYTPERIEVYVGAGNKGGIQANLCVMQKRGAANAATANRNYVCAQTFASATTSDGGTASTRASGQGQLFAGADLAVLYPGATFWRNITAREINVQVSSGASVAYKSGIQIVQMPDDAVSGAVDDGALSFSNQTGAVGWDNLILIGAMNGISPLKTTGAILSVKDTPTFANGIILNGAIISGNAFASPGFAVNGAGDLAFRNAISTTSGALVRLGAPATASSVAVQFLSSGSTASFYDSALIGSAGSGVQGAGVLSADASVFQPAADNTTKLGTTGKGWTQLRLSPGTVAALGTCNSGAEGTLKAVTDSNSVVFNAAVAGGGTNHVLAYCNGTGWTVH